MNRLLVSRIISIFLFVFGLLQISAKVALADDSKLVAPAAAQGVVESRCEWGEDERDRECTPNRCGITNACWTQDDDWNCFSTRKGCGYGGGSTTFEWDGVSKVWISGKPFDASFTSAMMKSRAQDGRLTCEDIPLSMGGGGRCNLNDGNLLGSTLVDDRGIYTLNGYVIDLFYDYGMPSEGHGNPGNTGGACDGVSAHAPMLLNDGSVLKFYNNPTPRGFYASAPNLPPNPPVPQVTIPSGTLLKGINTISVQYKDVCGQTFRSQTPIYVVTDGKFKSDTESMIDIVIQPFEDRLNSNGCVDSGESIIGSSWDPRTISLVVKDYNTGAEIKTITPEDRNRDGTYKLFGVPVGQKIKLEATSASAPNGYSTFTGYDNGGVGRCGIAPNLTSNSNNKTIFVGYTKNLSWLRAYDADVYVNDGIALSIPPLTVGLIDNYLINNTIKDGGGAGFAAVGRDQFDQPNTIKTYLTSPPNRTSVNGATASNPVGWQVEGYPGGMKYFRNLVFGLNYPTIDLTKDLSVNSFYSVNGDITLPSTYTFTNSDRGTSVVYVKGNVTILGSFKNSKASLLNSQGVIIIADGKITINPSSTSDPDEIDAVLISNDTIVAPKNDPSPRLNIYGALYAKNGLGLPRQLVNNNVDAAINVFLQPIYFFTNSKDLNRPTISNWRELTPTE